MFCKNCGSEIPEESSFCPECGFQLENNLKVKENKNMIVALVISFILTGLGIAYAGNKKKGIILFVIGLIFNLIGRAVPVCAVIGILIWAYALFETYNEVRRANGEVNPNLIDDIKSFRGTKKIASIIVIAVILLLIVGGVISAFMPHEDTTSDYTTDYDVDDSYSSGDLSSDSSDYSSSSDDDTYSSSSNGRDVSSHYEGEYGTADTEGHINDDGSVDAHQTGHTDYGDYEINSHMDSDGNIHGTVNVGGKTYYVES